MFGWQSSARTRPRAPAARRTATSVAIVLAQHLERHRAPERLLDRLVDGRQRAGPSSSRTRNPSMSGSSGHQPRPTCTSRETPVISAGCGSPSSSSIVGATSQMRPPRRSRALRVGVVDVEQRHRVERVRGVGLAGRRVLHQLAVAVIGRDEDRAASRARRLDDLRRRPRRRPRPRGSRRRACRCARPCRGWRSSRGRSRTSPLRTASATRPRDRGRAHLRLLVVGRHLLRRGQHLAVLALEGLLPPAVEEVGDVRVLLGLRAAELREPRARDDLGEDVGDTSPWGRRWGGRSVASYVVMHA